MSRGNFAVFIPLQGCPYHCIYCDQKKISGQTEMSPQIAGDILHKNMPLWRERGMGGQIAFFGGTFTGLSEELMREYLARAIPYLSDGSVDGIRISTRPDCIDEHVLSILSEYGVTHIELGVQSLDDEVLRAAGRGYGYDCVRRSAEMILRGGFTLGMQMMPGLPRDTWQKSVRTAERIISLGASETRIYPTIVLKDTPLAGLWKDGKYQPMELSAAVELCAKLKILFNSANVTVLKVGLHAGLVEKDILAGPFHPAFGQLVNSYICLEKLREHCRKNGLQNGTLIAISLKYDYSDIVGQRRLNAEKLKTEFNIELKISKKVLTNEMECIIL